MHRFFFFDGMRKGENGEVGRWGGGLGGGHMGHAI